MFEGRLIGVRSQPYWSYVVVYIRACVLRRMDNMRDETGLSTHCLHDRWGWVGALQGFVDDVTHCQKFDRSSLAILHISKTTRATCSSFLAVSVVKYSSDGPTRREWKKKIVDVRE